MYILNDYSVDKQFNNKEEFLDSLIENTIPLFKSLDEMEIDILKSHKIYYLEIIEDKKLIEIIQSRQYPEITRFKSLLNKILCDNPYWDLNSESNDCILEAIKNRYDLISFEHEEYLLEELQYHNTLVMNSYNKIQLEEGFYKKGLISLRELILSQYSNMVGEFCLVNNIDYFNNLINDNKLIEKDILKIKEDLIYFLNLYKKHESLGRFHDHIEDNLEEFRTSISDNRQIRILYTNHKSKLYFLNAFLKKTQKTPESEKKLGRNLAKKIRI